MTTFLSGPSLWSDATSLVRRSKRTSAAVAYVGRGAYSLLPLRTGDTLVVDLSLATVRAGVTDPHEIGVFISKGVRVFSRPFLHAKVIVTDSGVLAGSGNASGRSAHVLAEAGIYSAAARTRSSAAAFIKAMCTQEVGPEYLALCKAAYRPPRYVAGAPSEQARPKAWVARLESEYNIPDRELGRYEKEEAKASKLVKDTRRYRHDSFHWPSLPKMGKALQPGDLIVTMQVDRKGNAEVSSPVRFLKLTKYPRGGGKFRYIFHYETPIGETEVKWSQFRRHLPASLKSRLSKPRTIPIVLQEEADQLAALWTPSGRFRR